MPDVRFLSPAWLDALDEALAASPAVADATASTTLTLKQVVTGGPGGDVAYVVSVAGGVVRVAAAAPGDAADVTMTTSWDTAVGIATGSLAPHDAFTTGHLVVRGDIDALRAAAPGLAGLHQATEGLRATTTYGPAA
jgi:putative sterol carrier protein